ncbi:hypothetical protein BT63DRAFT_460586 [Microthyrium microscopicum]|uniref:Heterokaryon incompatibility domain-containing protein n=1 Tax=Microthyrium microscopicum TaxID=703497 RepID=A0A6A6TX26_9PEZI|nr:hypothetical protein BT63DRAFT_460586 [Microthyrium microscopicum]
MATHITAHQNLLIHFASSRLRLDPWIPSVYAWTLEVLGFYLRMCSFQSPVAMANGPLSRPMLPMLLVATKPIRTHIMSNKGRLSNNQAYNESINRFYCLILWHMLILALHHQSSPIVSIRLNSFIDWPYKSTIVYFVIKVSIVSELGIAWKYEPVESALRLFHRTYRLVPFMLRLVFGDIVWSTPGHLGPLLAKAATMTAFFYLSSFLFEAIGNCLSMLYRGAIYFDRREWYWPVWEFAVCLSWYVGQQLKPSELSEHLDNRTRACSKQFEYTTLPADKDTIRLLLIHPRPPTSPLKCTLFETTISSLPQYEAISYCWGKPERNSEIVVNDRLLKVPANALEVLKNRSSVWEPKLVWLDSVCINQRDSVEKGRQVLLMTEIYEKASTVSVELLGTPDEEAIMNAMTYKASQLGVSPDCIESIWQMESGVKPHKTAVLKRFMANIAADVFEELYQSYWRCETTHERDMYDRFAPYRLSLSFDIFRQVLSNPWFERMWIVQEVALARGIRVRYEGIEIPWDHFIAVFDLINTKHRTTSLLLMDGLDISPEGEFTTDKTHRPIASATFDAIAEIRRRIQSKEELRLVELLERLRMFKATNDRDKIFAIHGLCSTKPNHLLEPDYSNSRTDESIFINVAECLVEEGDASRMLAAAGTPCRSKASPKSPMLMSGHLDLVQSSTVSGPNAYLLTKDLVLPSWVPDWTRMPAAAQLSFVEESIDYRAGGIRKMKAKVKNGVLHLEDGHIFDNIVELCDTWEYHTILDEAWEQSRIDKASDTIRLSITKILESPLAKSRYQGDKPLEEAFWRTAVGNRVFETNGSPAPPNLSDGFNQFKKSVYGPVKELAEAWGWKNDRDLHMSSMASFQRAVLKCWGGRRLCITSLGFIGAVPPSSELGDQIVIFAGMQTPSVLRGMAKHQHRYLGECYIHGIMNGEMLGPVCDGRHFEII